MKRLALTCATDLRLQYRNGFYAATLAVLLPSIWLLRRMSPNTAEQLIPAVLLGNILINTFYFVSGLLLLERVEGTLRVQRVTPLKIREYIASKLVTLTILSLLESLLLVLAIRGPEISLLPMAVGTSLAAILFSLAGMIMVARYASINEFLLPSIPVATALCLPVLGSIGVGHANCYWLHPIQGPISLMQTDTTDFFANTVFSIIYCLFWIAPMYHWAGMTLGERQAHNEPCSLP
jgi:fluoroquinolone transport system permease protein